MKTPSFIAIFVTLCSVSYGYPQGSAPAKHALVVAIGDYAPGSGFRHIFADNDARIITKLLRQQGFEDTIVLRNAQATKQGFLNAFALLRARVHAGDVVFIHFSTHGQQIQDMNGDEADGMDEAIALYDARSSTDNGYKGGNHLTDDEFGSMAEQLRKDLGSKGDLLVMVDACHSGTMTRGEDTSHIRGGYAPIILAGDGSTVTRGVAVDDGKVGMFCTQENRGGAGEANYVIFSACENSEVSTEYYYNHNYFGPLTWAFLNAVLNSTGENYTYNKLFHDIQYKMISMFEASRAPQHPAIESADAGGADRIIFGGMNIVQKPFLTISTFESPDRIRIRGGTVSGIFDSARISVFPEGTADPSRAGEPVSKGIVVQPGYMESVARLDRSIADTDPGKYWVFADRRKFSGYRISIGIGPVTDPFLKSRTAEVLQNCSFIIPVQENPLFVLRQKKESNDRLVIEYGTTRKICKDNITTEELENILLNLAQSQFLKELQASSPDILLEASFIPKDTLHFNKSRFIDPQTLRYTFREKCDTAVLRIVNTGLKSIWFNVVDIDPENRITVFLPNNERTVSDCFLKPGQVFTIANTFGKPYGTEILKVIASDMKFDLRTVIDSRERGEPAVSEAAGVTTFNLFFDVIK